tara:strand:- start:166 stop:438 length:273 start_codon:yes stop_codon:yes gene_type:complete
MFAAKNKLKTNFDLGNIVFYTLLAILTATLIAMSIGTTIFVIYVAEYFNLIIITSDFLNNQIVRKISFYSIIISVGYSVIKWIYNYWYNN